MKPSAFASRLLPAFLLGLAACAPAAPPAEMGAMPITEEDRAAIMELQEAYNEALAANDFEAMVALYADDFVEMRPEALVGRQAALDYYTAMNSTYTAMESRFVSLDGLGDHAWGHIEGTGTFERTDGQVVDFNFSQLSKFSRNAAGVWQIHMQAFDARLVPRT